MLTTIGRSKPMTNIDHKVEHVATFYGKYEFVDVENVLIWGANEPLL